MVPGVVCNRLHWALPRRSAGDGEAGVGTRLWAGDTLSYLEDVMKENL